MWRRDYLPSCIIYVKYTSYSLNDAMSISSNPPLSETAEHYRSSLITIEEIHTNEMIRRVPLERTSERFEGIELERSLLSIYAGEALLCSLLQNAVGNYNDLTYTCYFPNRAETILPAPVAGQEPFQYFFDTSFAEVFCLDPKAMQGKSEKIFCLTVDSTGAVTLSHLALRKEDCWPLEYQLETAQRSGEVHDHARQTLGGMDGSIEAGIDGYEVFMDTSRQLGRCKNYNVNGDNIGCDVQRGIAILADGLGGHGNDHLASAFAVRKILESSEHVGRAVSYASEQLERGLNYYLNQQKFRVNVNRPSQLSDTTIIAAEMVDSNLYVVNIGDGRWFHIRDGKIIKKSWNKGSMRGVLIEKGILSERDGYELQKTDNSSGLGSTVVSTLLNYTVHDDCPGPEIASLDMQPGDYFVGFTDGFDAVTEEEIMNVLEDTPDLFVASEGLKQIVTRKNIAKRYNQPLSDGTMVEGVPSPCDNASLMLVRKE